MPTKEQQQIVDDIAAYHNEEGRKHFYNWVRTCVAILAPSLALLIGLQDNDLGSSCLLLSLLVSAISLMTISSLLGLLALHSESKGHALSRDLVIQEHNKGVPLSEIEKKRLPLPWYYEKAIVWFPFSFGSSLLLLGVFGIAKYII